MTVAIVTDSAASLPPELAAEHHVTVVPMGLSVGAEGLVVLAAARAAQAGADIDGVEAAARSVIDRVRLIATVNSLDRLVQSGRVPQIAGWAGSLLGVNPLFEFLQGKVKRLRPAF